MQTSGQFQHTGHQLRNVCCVLILLMCLVVQGALRGELVDGDAAVQEEEESQLQRGARGGGAGTAEDPQQDSAVPDDQQGAHDRLLLATVQHSSVPS